MIHQVFLLLLTVLATTVQGQLPDPNPVQFESTDKRFVKGMITCACAPTGRGVEEGAVGIITTGLEEVESILAGNSTGAGDMTTEQDLRTQAVLRSAQALAECVTATNFEACINVAANMRSRFAGNTLCDHDSVTGKNVRSVDPVAESTTKVTVGLCSSNEQFASPGLGGVVVPVTGTTNPPSAPSVNASPSKSPAPSKAALSKSSTPTPSKAPPSLSKTPAPPKKTTTPSPSAKAPTPSKTPTPSPKKATPSPSKKVKPSESASKKPKPSASPSKKATVKQPVVVPEPPNKKLSPSPSKKSVPASKKPAPSPSTSSKPLPSTSPTSPPPPSISPNPKKKPCVQTSWLAERGLMEDAIKHSGMADVLCIPGLPCGTHGHLLRTKSGELRTYREICAELTECTSDRVEVSQLSHATDWAVFESNGLELTSLSAHPESTSTSPTRRLAMLADKMNKAGLGHLCNAIAMMPQHIESAVYYAKYFAVESLSS